jgi:hypothetical protein
MGRCMAFVRILAGDIKPQTAWLQVGRNKVRLIHEDDRWLSRIGLASSKIDFRNEVEGVEIQTEESVRDLLDTASWAAAGALLAGPLGAVIGGVFGGHKKEVCFAAYLKDGRKFLAVADSDTFRQIQAAVF